MKIRRSNTKSARSRRGISLVEVIVALAVIAIISTAALSLVISSSKVDANSLRSTQVMMALLRNTGDYKKVDNAYVLTEKAYVVTISYTDKKLTFSATDSDGKVIYDYEFNKG